MIRSWLFVPGDDPRKLAKAGASGADALIVDLEDSVSPSRKAEARQLAAGILKDRPAGTQLWIRINPLSGDDAAQDLEIVAPLGPDGIVLPKPDSAADVAHLGTYLSAFEHLSGLPDGHIRVLPIATETPRSLFTLGSYGDLPKARLAGLTWGAEDLPAAVGAETNRASDGGYSDLCRLARTLCVAGAAAAGVAAIETVYPAFRDLTGLEAYAEQGRRDGFAGMMAIHPDQVAVINRVFTPAPERLERARRIVALFEANPGAGVLSLDGQMLDAPHLKQAQRLIGIER